MSSTCEPLQGIRVIDFCWVGAGSFATKMLADQGAEVIKIESSAKIDGIRLSGPFAGGVKGINRSGYFADRNTSKRSLALNLKTERGQEIAKELVADCHVVANNFSPGVMARFGLGWEDVQNLNPRAVYLAMSMQGSRGPERDYIGYGLTISALVGFHYLTGLPGRPAVGTGTNYPDHIPNPTHAAFAVLAALRHSRRTGRGQMIDLAQTEATIAVLGPAMMECTANGSDRPPSGNRHDLHAPHGVFPTVGDDRWIAIAVTDDQAWLQLVEALRIQSVIKTSWATVEGRGEDVDAIESAVAEAVEAWDVDELTAELQSRGVAAGPVHDAQGVVDGDPQLQHRGHWLRLDHAEMGRTLYNNVPYRMSSTPTDITVAAPLLGEHTREICRDVLRMTDATIDELIEAGILQ